MARGQAKSNITNDGPLARMNRHQGQSRSAVKKQAVRKSARLDARQARAPSIPKSYSTRDIQALPSPRNTPDIHLGSKVSSTDPTPCHTADLIEASHLLQPDPIPSDFQQKRKRGHEIGPSSSQDPFQAPLKRPRISLSKSIDEKRTAGDINKKNVDSLKHWIQTGGWPEECFEQNNHTREELEQDSWLKEMMIEFPIPSVQYIEINGFRLPQPIRQPAASLRRKKSDSSMTSSNDQNTKTVRYRDPRYKTLLESKGSHMCDFEYDVPRDMENDCRRLLKEGDTVPRDSLFREDRFKQTCWKIQDRNEARVIRDIGRLIVPSAETLATCGATHLGHLIEGVNEAWLASIPFEGPKPQPDYSVGFKRSAFTQEQLRRLDPLIGSLTDTSYFVATYRMYFPFLTTEVKCGAAALDVADRQNTHSMTLAVRGVIELYRAVHREQELDQKILAFSISHDDSSVKIYGHYPKIQGDQAIFYRHSIRQFNFTELDGKEKWIAYHFTKNVYDFWMPDQHKLICSAIDDLPADIDFGVPQLASSSQHPSQISPRSSIESSSQSSLVGSQGVTPTTFFTQTADPASKKPRHGSSRDQQR